MEYKLHQYQERLVDFLIAHDKAIISVDMGLGKTASVLHYLERRRPASVLIVAPKRVAETVWLQEAYKWDLAHCSSNMVICSGTAAKRRQALSDASKPYKIMGRDNIKDVEGMRFDVLVLDELTSFKTVDCMRSSIVRRIAAPVRIGLTGTFIANGAIDIFGQAAALGLFKATDKVSRKGRITVPEFYSWRSYYFVDVLSGSGMKFSKWKPTKPLDEILRPLQANIFTLRAADYLEIPPVSYVPHWVSLSTAERSGYDSMEAMLMAEVGGEVVSADEDARFMKLQTLADGFMYDVDGSPYRHKDSSKLSEVAEFCARCAAEGERVLLFYAFKEEARWLCEKFDSYGLRYTSAKCRGFMEDWTSGNVDVLMAHPASAGHGLNLQDGGRMIVWSSITYNFESWAQANARLARQGQRKAVQVHVFMAADTIEASKYEALMRKGNENEEFKELTA